MRGLDEYFARQLEESLGDDAEDAPADDHADDINYDDLAEDAWEHRRYEGD